jgi:hypothetical protein
MLLKEELDWINMSKTQLKKPNLESLQKEI